MYRKVTIITFICLAFVFVALTNSVIAQDKKFAEIVGNYEFDYEGQIMLISFWEEDGVLYGAPEGETPEAIDQVEGKPLNFEVTPAGGQLYELEFQKDEAGKVTKCVLLTQGFEVEGVKVKK